VVAVGIDLAIGVAFLVANQNPITYGLGVLLLLFAVLVTLVTVARPPLVKVYGDSMVIRRMVGTLTLSRTQIVDVETRPVKAMLTGAESRSNRRQLYFRWRDEQGHEVVTPAAWSRMLTGLGAFDEGEWQSSQHRIEEWIRG